MCRNRFKLALPWRVISGIFVDRVSDTALELHDIKIFWMRNHYQHSSDSSPDAAEFGLYLIPHEWFKGDPFYIDVYVLTPVKFRVLKGLS